MAPERSGGGEPAVRSRADDIPNPEEGDLSQAFGDAPAKRKAGPKVQPPPPRLDVRAAFRDASVKAERAVASGDVEAAKAALAEVRTQAQPLGAAERSAVVALEADVAALQDDEAAAVRAAFARFGDCADDACRQQARKGLGALAKKKSASPELATRLKAFDDARTCARKAEHSSKPPACFKAAARLLKAEGDVVALARVDLARALSEGTAPKRKKRLESAARACRAAACAPVRLKAYAELAKAARSSGDEEGAARFALLGVSVELEALPKDERRWGRTADLEAACARFDAKSGAGACRRLEQKVLGEPVFTDFSKELAGEALPADVVRTVNQHFWPTLQPCLAQQARTLVPPESLEFEVRWTVFPDGQVGEVHLRADLDGSELARCLRGALTQWRYPRYQGEWQHVEQRFTVSASEKRVGAR